MYVRRHVDDMCILIAGSIGDRCPCILVFGVFNVILYTKHDILITYCI